MNPAVRFEDEADIEYRAAARWYEERQSGLGTEFLDAVDAVLDRVVRSPDAGAPVPRLPSVVPARRAPVKRFPFHVIYVQTSGAIRVLAIAHDRRRPGYWMARL